MADEKDIKAEELTDEQADEVAGGGPIASKPYRCKNYPYCEEMVRFRGTFCEKCRAKMRGN